MFNLVMEKLRRRWHLTNAACQLEDTTIDEAITLLKEAIMETIERRKCRMKVSILKRCKR